MWTAGQCAVARRDQFCMDLQTWTLRVESEPGDATEHATVTAVTA